jgi:cytochrome c oxidase subunit 1
MPALGITSEVISTNARKPIFGYTAMIISLMGISFLSFIVWGHHMFITGMNPFLGSVFMILTLIIAVPSAVKVFNYLTTLWRGNLRFNPAMLFSIGLVSFFISGGLTGIYLGNAALDIQLHDSYFVVAHFHLVMGSAAIFGMFAGIYHWFPKMYGRMLNQNLGYFHFWLTFIAAYLVFFPMHFMGLAGVPRRYYMFTLVKDFEIWGDTNKLITVAALVGGFAQLLFLYNFFYSMFRGKKATQNPWGSNTLEWSTPVEHLHGNWPGEIPTVYRGPYEYSRPDREEDFFPQYVPDESAPEVLEPVKTKSAPQTEEVKETEESTVFFAAIKKVFGLS